jgi:hypothetical protein
MGTDTGILAGSWRGSDRPSLVSCIAMNRPMTGVSKSDTAIQPNNRIESDIVQPLKIAGQHMIGSVPCQEIKTYVVVVNMKCSFLAPASSLAHRQPGGWHGSVGRRRGIFSMNANWLGELLGGDQTLDAISNALVSAYGWAKEWQALLAGFLVLTAGFVVARSIRKASPGPNPQTEFPAGARLDMRREPKAQARPDLPDRSAELVGELEQLRSLIRSALSAFTLTAEKENSPVQFLCQRVARMRPDRFMLPASAPKSQHELFAGLLGQLDTLRQQLKRDVKPTEISATLIQLNASARGLVTALAPSTVIRRQAGSDLR